jgi:hypothetical protein
VDVVQAGGSASDLTERGDLEGRVCLPPDDLDREDAAAERRNDSSDCWTARRLTKPDGFLDHESQNDPV